ncbi:MAG: M1 family metallopeptidase [Capnocytophaga sp.]|nr:M1 family metallopeptidase [Capnocytophaga sp.]
MNHTKIIVTLYTFMAFGAQAQQAPWQQQADYTMDIRVDAENYRYTGTQQIVYKNNSPDTLRVVFYHLYYNAFQPGSEMDIRLQNIPDPDSRMTINKGTKENPLYESRIATLKPSEIGYINVLSLTHNSKKTAYTTEGTILKVTLDKPILPNTSATFDMEFEAQIPVMIRRTGRNSRDGVALSMAQWYPKMAAYDGRGWHANEYIAREFYGIWGDYDVKITIDKKYVLGGSGYLQNPNEIGHGYQDDGVKVKPTKAKTLTWHFSAPKVHDFTWAADPDFKHDKIALDNGRTFHFLYKKYDENWQKIQPEMVEVFKFFNNIVGEYPWEQYSFIQGGDGGMEYAMCTLIAGGENYKRLRGTAIHELAHAWFQHLLATDEASYAWMDEGFTSFIEDLATQQLDGTFDKNPFAGAYQSYYRLVQSGLEEPATTHADRYDTNFAYSIMAYSKGTLFLTQLAYIIGEKNVMKTLQQFYKEFSFRHPTPIDFIRTAEKVSGMQLRWFLNEFIDTTHTLDYAIDNVRSRAGKTVITLRRIGRMPMPVDLFVMDKNQKTIYYYIPSRLQFGEKENPYKNIEQKVLPAWGWAYPTYEVVIDTPLEAIAHIVIDPEELTVDVNKENNVYPNP